jgi:hypothetical protein
MRRRQKSLADNLEDDCGRRAVCCRNPLTGDDHVVPGVPGVLWRGALSLLSGNVSEAKGKKGKGKEKGKGKGKGGKKKCGKGKKPCNGQCIAASSCYTDKDCNVCALEICQDGMCGCHPSRIRVDGVCGEFPHCQPAGAIVNSESECCSDEAVLDIESGQIRCLPGDFQCLTLIDCTNKAPCRGYMCPGLYNSHTLGATC